MARITLRKANLMKARICLIFLLSLTSLQTLATNFLLVGDTGQRNSGQEQVAKAMVEYCKKEVCNLAFLLGDNIYEVGASIPNDPLIEASFDKYYNELKIPFLVSLGNHDYGVKTNDWKRADYQVAHSQKNPLFHLPHFWYTYETSEAVIAVIDTARLMWKKDVLAQAQMIEDAYAKALDQDKWFLVSGHHPYLSNGKHGNAGSYDGIRHILVVSGYHVKKFLDAHVCNKAHFYLSGHDHNLQVYDGQSIGCKTQMIVSGSGSSVEPLKGRNKSLYQSSKLGFMHLIVDPSSARLKVLGSTSDVLFEKTYSK